MVYNNILGIFHSRGVEEVNMGGRNLIPVDSFGHFVFRYEEVLEGVDNKGILVTPTPKIRTL